MLKVLYKLYNKKIVNSLLFNSLEYIKALIITFTPTLSSSL